MYSIENDLLNEKAEIRLGDMVYAVDNRLSTYLALNRALQAEGADRNELEVVLTYALGAEVFAGVLAKDYPFPVMRRLAVLAMAAMQGVDAPEAERRFRQGAGV